MDYPLLSLPYRWMLTCTLEEIIFYTNMLCSLAGWNKLTTLMSIYMAVVVLSLTELLKYPGTNALLEVSHFVINLLFILK